MRKRIILISILVICLILFLAYFIMGNYFYNISINPKKDKTFILGGYEETEEQLQKLEEQKLWLDNNSKDVYITSNNNGNLKLHAYEIENQENNIWVIAVHGYMSKASALTRFAQKFNDRGYNVLVIDLRGHGLSEGKYIGMGWHDRLDLIDWINYIIEKNPENRIILFGISMGAGTVMMAEGEELPKNVKLAISDCGYTCAWDEFCHQMNKLFDLCEFPILYAANTVCKIKAGYSFKEASAVEQIKKSKTPTLFIHGSEDDFVPFKMLDKVYEAAACEKEKLIIEGATHGQSSAVNPEKYWSTVDNFIEKYLD